MEKHLELGQQMGLEGQKLLEYCLAQQKIELEERAAERKSQQARREAEAEKTLREAEAAKVRREIEEEKAKREAEEAAEQRRVDFQLQ